MTSDRTLPLQGGLTPDDAGRAVGDVVEIACDESGFSGSNLLDASTPLFTHASVDLSVDEAADLTAALQTRHGRTLDELKSGHLRRAADPGQALGGLLSALDGRAHVVLVDKEFFLATRIGHLFLAEPSYASGTRLTGDDRAAALALYRSGRAAGPAWGDFLAALVALVRTKRRPDGDLVARFLRARDRLTAEGLDPGAAAALDRLTAVRVGAVVARLVADDRSIPPPLEPLLPALAETVRHWSAGRQPVLVVHDEQSALTADRLRRLQQALADEGEPTAPPTTTPTTTPTALTGVVVVDSRDDPRVQLADLLAGAARRLPAVGDGGPLARFVSATSWSDPIR